MKNNVSIKEIVRLFLKLGFLGFGGPAAHIAMMQQEVVAKRKWMSEQHFLDLLGATNLIPGPNSTEMAIHIGYDKRGWKGMLAAGLCLILPAVFITGVFAFLYRKYGHLPEVEPFVYGIQPAVISVILGAIYPLAKKSVKTFFLAIMAITVLIASLFGINEIYLMFGAGLFGLAYFYIRTIKHQNTLQNVIPFFILQLGGTNLFSEINVRLFWIFLKIGAVLYGSGYVLFAFLDTELVQAGLLSRQQLMDAIAVGQFTPGPVFSSVTFIGYQINGISGALWSTIAIFLPSFVLVALINPLMKKMRQSKLLSVFLDSVNVAAIALIASVCFTMGNEVIADWRTLLIAVISIFVVFRFKKLNSAFVILGGAFLGLLLYQL